jgi:small-conductance mechanosensitive channel
MAGPTLLDEVLNAVQQDVLQPRLLWQLAVIGIALLAGGLYARWIRQKVQTRLDAASGPSFVRIDVLKFSVDGIRRLAFPVSSMLLIIAGGLMLRGAGLVQRSADVQLLRLALTLLGAMAAIRLFVYILRRSLPRSVWLGTFERAIVLAIWLLVALHVTGLLAELGAALDSIRIPLGKLKLTLLDLLIGLVSVALTVVAALWAGSVIESRLIEATSIAPNSRVVLSRISKALLTLVAVLVALSMVGIDLTVLSVFGGALGVGLGLGLQRIASNYVSGFIILFDRSLSIGDMITVDKYYGAVTQINTRYTVMKALDGTETIVPNEMLVSSPVVNHSYSDRRVRVAVKVSIAYHSNVDLALAILTEAARAQPRVLAEPQPSSFVTGLGADGIDLEVGFWIRDPEEGTLAVRSEIARTLLRRFREEAIEIPYPQRDIRITSLPDSPKPAELVVNAAQNRPTAGS